MTSSLHPNFDNCINGSRIRQNAGGFPHSGECGYK